MDLGGVIYYMREDHLTPVDLYFRELNNKLVIYEYQTEITERLYKNELAASHLRLKKAFDENMETAKVKYDRVFEETAGSDTDRHALAAHESDWNYLCDKNAADQEYLDLRYAEMADNFYKSDIMVLFTVLESELKRLCKTWQTQVQNSVGLADLGSRDYISASWNYITNVMNLDMSVLQIHQNKLTDLQNLRNRQVHDGGYVYPEWVNQMKKVVNSSGKAVILKPESEGLLIWIRNVSNINSWYQNIRSFFEDLFWEIDRTQNYVLLKKRLQYLLGATYRQINIDQLIVIKTGKKRELRLVLEIKDAGKADKFDCQILLKTGLEEKVTLLNQVVDNEDLLRLEKLLANNADIIFKRAFAGFLLTKDTYQAVIKLIKI